LTSDFYSFYLDNKEPSSSPTSMVQDSFLFIVRGGWGVGGGWLGEAVA